MNVDEAIENLEAISNIVRRVGYAAWADGINECIDGLRVHVERKVDDAMVERADKAYWDEQAKNWASEDDYRFMKAALIAALGVEG